MGQTIIEKIVSRNIGHDVHPGDIVTVNVDRVMIHDIFIPFVAEKFEEMGFQKLWDPDKVDLAVATAVYTGMIHDTGVFQYSSTSPETMRIAGELMKTGIPFSRIIDESFYQKTYIQNQVMGRVLAESILLQNGTCIIGYLRKKDMDFYGVTGSDLDGIVSQLRLTRGVEVAIFIYELETQSFKVSLRSNGRVDVSKVAVFFGGGGHTRAAGCDLQGSMYDVINNITAEIEKQLTEEENA